MPGFPYDTFPDPAPAGTPADLLEAIVAYLGARPDLAAAFGHDDWLWGDEAAAGTALPACDLSDFDSQADYATADGTGSVPYDDDGEFQLIVYAAGKAQARSLGQLLEAALDDAPLAFSAGTLLQLRRTRAGTEKDPDLGPGGCDVWARRLFFRAIVARTL